LLIGRAGLLVRRSARGLRETGKFRNSQNKRAQTGSPPVLHQKSRHGPCPLDLFRIVFVQSMLLFCLVAGLSLPLEKALIRNLFPSRTMLSVVNFSVPVKPGH
jgi:hypothetical protein